jgi:hypothetical protein
LDNLSGYAWSDNIGWVSFNCTSDGTCGTSPYGVKFTLGGNMEHGYAWSDNIGWISFNASDVVGCPSAPCTPTLNNITGAVTGWARAIGASGGWDGWISLSGTATDGSPYGVSVTNCSWNGYAWGSDVVGWLSFSGIATNGSPYGVTGTDAACQQSAEPDLVSQDLAVSSGPYYFGFPISISARVFNGGANTGIGFSDSFSYQWNGTGGAWNNVPGGTIAKAALITFNASTDGPVNFTPTQTGTLYFQHCVDSTNVVNEGANETPNCTVTAGLAVNQGPSGTLNANTPVNYGSSTVLVWSTSDTAPCVSVRVVDEGGSEISTQANHAGFTTATLAADKTFYLQCVMPSSTLNLDSATVDVRTAPTLTLSQRIIAEGDSVDLDYNTYGQNCIIRGGGSDVPVGPVYGNSVGAIERSNIGARTTFTLDCPLGDVFATVEILARGFES